MLAGCQPRSRRGSVGHTRSRTKTFLAWSTSRRTSSSLLHTPIGGAASRGRKMPSTASTRTRTPPNGLVFLALWRTAVSSGRASSAKKRSRPASCGNWPVFQLTRAVIDAASLVYSAFVFIACCSVSMKSSLAYLVLKPIDTPHKCNTADAVATANESAWMTPQNRDTDAAHVALTMTSPLRPYTADLELHRVFGININRWPMRSEPTKNKSVESLQCLQSIPPYELYIGCHSASNVSRSSTRTRMEQHSGMASAACVECTTPPWWWDVSASFTQLDDNWLTMRRVPSSLAAQPDAQ
jgi:hypothetical protein